MSSTALVLVGPERPAASTVNAGEPARAEFLTQLIAIRAQVPQMRLRRRAEPGEAIAAYAAQGRTPRTNGCALSRSL
ncbi:MAG TPA: hypothetical protein VEJ37_12485 [Xanthobacteraceae bacterium]|nr:hypothetical protein [Xanthobacteraceae bacterium]